MNRAARRNHLRYLNSAEYRRDRNREARKREKEVALLNARNVTVQEKLSNVTALLDDLLPLDNTD